MNWDAIYPLVSQWYQTGLLAETDKPLLQEAYTELTGDTGERCRRCESYWSDVQHTLRYHLIKVLGYSQMSNNSKYIISEEAGYLQVHGLPYVYVNKGKPENESAKHLTDEIAEHLLKENPDRAQVIVKNPDYDPEKDKSAAAAKKPATSAAKPAAKTGGKAKTADKPKEEKPVDPPAPPADDQKPVNDQTPTEGGTDNSGSNS